MRARWGMSETLTVNDALRGHMGLDLECLDRIYLNGYVPTLQVAGQVVSFMTRILGYPIPSPAIMEKIGTSVQAGGQRVRRADHIPIVRFAKDDRKLEVMRRHLAAQARTGRSGVAAIGVAQEFQNVFAASKRTTRTGPRCGSPSEGRPAGDLLLLLPVGRRLRSGVHQDLRLLPLPGQGVAQRSRGPKRQATDARIGFTELSNGFATCEDPEGLQAICDRLGPGTINVFFERWISRPAATADLNGPGGRILVGTVDAADRGLPHHRVRRTPSRTGVLRSPGGRQPRHRPTRPPSN